MNLPYKKGLLAFVLIALSLEAILFYVAKYNEKIEILRQEKINEQKVEILKNVPVLAKAVSVYDITLNKKIYGMNDKTSMPIASLVKIMTVLTALSEKNSEEVIVISKNAVDQFGDYGLYSQEKIKVGDLAKFTLVGSSNDGAYALSEISPEFLKKMNEKAKRIGLQNSFFLSPTGLDENGEATSFASAEDVNIMSQYAYRAYPDIFRATTLPEIKFISVSRFEHSIKNTYPTIEKNKNLLFFKTGNTDIAGGNLAIIFKNKEGHDIAVTVLGSTEKGRFEDMEKLVNVLSDS